uniref:Uncharacterized protein n=1 Tax=Oryza nivara TaxID=4536 RepID=A0A0E0FF70_ORYNI
PTQPKPVVEGVVRQRRAGWVSRSDSGRKPNPSSLAGWLDPNLPSAPAPRLAPPCAACGGGHVQSALRQLSPRLGSPATPSARSPRWKRKQLEVCDAGNASHVLGLVESNF